MSRVIVIYDESSGAIQRWVRPPAGFDTGRLGMASGHAMLETTESDLPTLATGEQHVVDTSTDSVTTEPNPDYVDWEAEWDDASTTSEKLDVVARRLNLK